MLEMKQMCVCEITAIIGSSMPTISNHLRILKEADIITFTKENRYMVYKLNYQCESVENVLELLVDVSDEQLENDLKKMPKTNQNHICSASH